MEVAKNKKTTYLLICAVAVVWGIILYKVFFNDSGDQYELKPSQSTEKHEAYDQYVTKEDTFKLALNYKDPFTGDLTNAKTTEDVSGAAAMPVISLPPPPVKPPLDWSIIKYSGYIINPKTKKLVSILVVRGREQMLAEGESFDGVKLIKNRKDSVLLSWQGKQKYIRQ